MQRLTGAVPSSSGRRAETCPTGSVPKIGKILLSPGMLLLQCPDPHMVPEGSVHSVDMPAVFDGQNTPDVMLLTSDQVSVPNRECFQEHLMRTGMTEVRFCCPRFQVHATIAL